MADTFKITQGPSEMDLMFSYFRDIEVTFLVEAEYGSPQYDMKITAMGKSPNGGVVMRILKLSGFKFQTSLDMLWFEGRNQTCRYFILFNPKKREGILTDFRLPRGRQWFEDDPLIVCWADLVHGGSDWR